MSKIQSITKFAAVLCTLLVLWGCLKKPSGGPSLFPHLDKLLHFGAYALLAFLYHLGFRLSPAKLISSLFLFGLAIEIAQWPLSYRSFALNDLLSNFVGILYGLLFLKGLLGFRNVSVSN